MMVNPDADGYTKTQNYLKTQKTTTYCKPKYY